MNKRPPVQTCAIPCNMHMVGVSLVVGGVAGGKGTGEISALEDPFSVFLLQESTLPVIQSPSGLLTQVLSTSCVPSIALSSKTTVSCQSKEMPGD